MIDLDSLTLGEVATIERIGEGSVSSLAEADKPKARMLIALAYVIKRREDPTFTVNAAEALTMAEVNKLAQGGETNPEALSA